MAVRLVKPTIHYADSFKEMADEYLHFLEDTHKPMRDNYVEYLQILKNCENGIVPEGFVPSTTYFVERMTDNKLLGCARIHHKLDDRILENGHICGDIRPTERNKGYASAALLLCLKEAERIGLKEVILACKRDNIPSKAVIEKYSHTMIYDIPKCKYLRYRINL